MPKQENKLKILYITRKYPPATGGMETVAYELHKYLTDNTNVTIIKWSTSIFGLHSKIIKEILTLILYPYFFLVSIFSVIVNRPDIIYLQDGVLAPIGAIIKLFYKKPIAMTVHGLDLTYENKFYQAIITRSIKRIDKLIAVSQSTAQLALSAGGKTSQVVVIPNGVRDIYRQTRTKSLRALSDSQKKAIAGYRVLFTNGRLVERKGVDWFINNVLPELAIQNPNVLYVVSGKGPKQKNIEQSVKAKNLQDHVLLLGFTSDPVLKAFYNLCDIFVMPNIPVRGDREGFGVVALEAATCERVVVASDLEGISEAIITTKNGYLVEPKDSTAYIKVIGRLLSSKTQTADFGHQARQYTLDNYSWIKISEAYLNEFRQLSKT